MSRVAIVGAGAMGSVYAGLMAESGHDVHAVTLWADHVAAMSESGLRVSGFSGDRTMRVHASTSTDGIPVCDLVVIATKAADVEAAANCPSLRHPRRGASPPRHQPRGAASPRAGCSMWRMIPRACA